MDNIQALLNDFLFRLSTLGWADILDLILVTLTFFLMFQLVRRSQAASILRGLTIVGALLLAITLLLPLPAFSAVVQVMAIASLVVIPVILQPELRRWLERLGRNRGLFGGARLSTAEQNVRAILKATEDMAANRQGALIVLEGRDSLQTYIDGGVSVKGLLSAELLQSIFYGENPLHDGAVVVRDDLVEAAGCVLPLSQAVPVTRRRLGTRHRAALGLSEISDALAIVVSEETGAISTARSGTLEHGLNSMQLGQSLLNFYAHPSDKPGPSKQAAGAARRGTETTVTLRGVFSQIGYLLLSALLALGLWGAISARQNPIRQLRVPNVPLTVVNKPSDWVLTSPVPETVSVLVQTDEATSGTISSQTFQATLDLADASLGLQRLPVLVVSSVEDVRIQSVDPSEVDVNLSESVTKTMIVEVVVADPESLPPSYQLVGKPQAIPPEVRLSGPASAVDLVARAEVSLSLNGTTSSVRTLLPVKLVDESGAEVKGSSIEPSQVLVTATIRRQNNVQDVGVRVVTEGSPPDGYWVSTISSDPASVTLRGAPADLEAIGSFITTAPVDISDARGQFSTQSPLQLPAGVDALDANGRAISSVMVLIQTTPLLGELVLQRDVVVQGLPAGTQVTVDPPTVQVLISGPVPTLDAIEQNPDLVQVYVNVTGLGEGESVSRTPQVIAPADAIVQVVEQTVIVTRGP